MTTFGIIGVKVWIFKKLHFVKSAKDFQQLAKAQENAAATKEALVPVPAPQGAPSPEAPVVLPSPEGTPAEGGTPHADA